MRRCLNILLAAIIVVTSHLRTLGVDPGFAMVAWFGDKGEAGGPNGEQREEVCITVSDYPVSADEMAPLLALEGVTGLDIGYFPDAVRIEGKALAKVGELREVENLLFYVSGVTEKDWSFLAKLPKLESLWIDGDESLNLGDGFLRIVSKLKNLKSLVVHSQAGDFSADGIALLASLEHLEDLRLTSETMTDQSLATFAKLKCLKTLDLWASHVTDEAAKQLAASRAFVEVSVNGVRLRAGVGGSEEQSAETPEADAADRGSELNADQ